MATFKYLAFKQLKHTLGQSDAAGEMMALAIRLLVNDLKEHTDKAVRLKELYDGLGIKVDKFDESELLARTYQLQILAVYEQAEEFLKALKRECPHCISWSPQADGEDKLSWFWKNLSSSQKQNEQAKVWKSVCEYYRCVRNEFLHSLGNDKRLENMACELRAEIKLQPELQRLKAPSIYSEIGFDDFILFSRVVKLLSEWLGNCLRPSDEDIAEMLQIIYKEKYGRPITHLKKHRGAKRRENSLKTLLQDTYCLSFNELDSVVNILLRGPLA